MRILNTGKRLSGFTAFLFGTALLCGAFFFSACETGFDPDTSIPLPAPRSIQVTAGDQSLVLQWTKIAPAQGVIPSYTIYHSEVDHPYTAGEGKEIFSNTSNLVKDTITGLDNHTLYYIWVKAVYAGLGESDFSPVTSGTPIPPPAIPGTLTITPSEEMLQVTWAGVPDAFTYEVYYQAGGTGAAPPEEAAMTTVSEAGAALSGLTNGTSYTLWVRAANTAGNSPGYATKTGIPLAAVTAPAKAPLKPDVIPGTGKLTLVWEPAAGVPYYKLHYGTTEEFSAATAVA
ncbi:MAG: fibronectin type III domain-containing protein, partial [Treponema sp.]|nr:fibronectin type III domain-containing protein [Treponema sp.]